MRKVKIKLAAAVKRDNLKGKTVRNAAGDVITIPYDQLEEYEDKELVAKVIQEFGGKKDNAEEKKITEFNVDKAQELIKGTNDLEKLEKFLQQEKNDDSPRKTIVGPLEGKIKALK